MKNVVFFLLFFLSSISVYSQFTPKIYSGIHAMYDRAFENNAYGAFEVGAELFEFKFLAPEIGVKYYSGSPNESEILNFDQNPPAGIAKFDSRFKSFVFSVGPKMRFGNEEAALVIIPEFNIGNIRTYKRYFVPRDNFYELTEEVEKTQAIKFWNFSAGIEGNFFELDKVTFGVLLTYSTINTEAAFKDLPLASTSRNYRAGRKNGLGLKLRAYFDIFQ